MKLLYFFPLFILFFYPVYADTDTLQFIQYADKNTALEEIRHDNLDVYLASIPYDRITLDDRENLGVYRASGNFYSILVNPATGIEFNPFSTQKARFALNFLVDRDLIVNELLGGHGFTQTSNYGKTSPTYLNIIDQVESFNFVYDSEFAKQLLTESLLDSGAVLIDDTWYYEDKPIILKFFIRSDDPVRKSIGELLAFHLEEFGFMVEREFGDLNKAFVLVYGSDPANFNWHLYTEAWASSAFVKHDRISLSQMYAPWLGNMPGFGNPSYWNYKHDALDNLTQRIYTGDFITEQDRQLLVQEAIVHGMTESIRIFLAGALDNYVTGGDITGVVDDFGAGISNRFTLVNLEKTDSNLVKIGMPQIYQGSWNPVGGFTDGYSRVILNTLSDPGVYLHPHSGNFVPFLVNYTVISNGNDGTVDIHPDSILWNSSKKQWTSVYGTATSMVTFDINFTKWHHGENMDMNDILYSLYFVQEWGTSINSTTFDPEFSPQLAPINNILAGIHIVDDDTITLYLDFWHFDDDEIANLVSVWPTTPWEIFVVMEQAVIDDKVAFTRLSATAKMINWLSLIVENDAMLISEYLKNIPSDYIPPALAHENPGILQSRYDSSIKWIDGNNHAVISNGPFQLESYRPESRTITVKAVSYDSINRDSWLSLTNVKLPEINSIIIPDVVSLNTPFVVNITTNNVDDVYYYLTNSKGIGIVFDSIKIYDNVGSIHFDYNILQNFTLGATTLKLFAISDDALRPDIVETNFITSNQNDSLPLAEFDRVELLVSQQNHIGIIFLIMGLVVVLLVVYTRRRSRLGTSNE
ncbi:MAG: ABC transporter substrate-binding protein [Candidatus Nitrosoabyssus spongiisocia]|nr:MAG: ABC transporter substrate-binding protein [Nitrosopumilaceae archaeon AB1(1)]